MHYTESRKPKLTLSVGLVNINSSLRIQLTWPNRRTVRILYYREHNHGFWDSWYKQKICLVMSRSAYPIFVDTGEVCILPSPTD